MNYILIPILCFVILMVHIIRKLIKIAREEAREKEAQERVLIEEITSMDRGTPSERNLILELLKIGISSRAIFHDLYIEKKNENYSQIDLVVLTTQGVVVIEVKEMSGWIFGNGHHSHWTQVLAYGKEKYKFYNPIKQNRRHIEILQKQLIQFENIPFISIVVFYGTCELKEINFVPNDTYIVKVNRISEVFDIIKETYNDAPYIDKREVLKYFQETKKASGSMEIQNKHIMNVKNMLGKDRIFK